MIAMSIVTPSAPSVTHRAEPDQALYRFFDADGGLLYVGVSLQPFQRMGQHRGDKSWWGEVATVTIERHPTREAVLAAERDAIRSERPRYNVVHTTERKGRPRVYWRFTYWEPAVGALISVPNVAPPNGVCMVMRCPRCDAHAMPTEFLEWGDGEITCRTKCHECRSFVQQNIPAPSGRFVVRRGSKR